MGFGTVLKDLLSDKNMSIKELSKESGIPLNTLYSITKRDTINVNQNTLEKISKTLDVPMDDLIKMLRLNIEQTEKELDMLKRRLYEAEKKRQHEIELRERLAHCLYDLTHYTFTDSDIDIIISTAILLKESPSSD